MTRRINPMSENKAKLFVVSAPSGCGKGTILSEVIKAKKFHYSVSCTTRTPRDGEVDGVNYYFIDKEKFKQMAEQGQFLEYAKFASNYYGTPEKAVRESLEKGIDIVLEIETKGAFQIREAMPEAVLIFILPPSVKELKRRLNKRGTEKDDVIEKRVSKAVGEICQSYKYDYVIMNDGLEEAIADFVKVYDSAKNEDSVADEYKPIVGKTKNMIDEVLKNA